MRLGHRYYDASVGRFLSRDPILAGYNGYTYCDNDPINCVDPEGLDGDDGKGDKPKPPKKPTRPVPIFTLEGYKAEVYGLLTTPEGELVGGGVKFPVKKEKNFFMEVKVEYNQGDWKGSVLIGVKP